MTTGTMTSVFGLLLWQARTPPNRFLARLVDQGKPWANRARHCAVTCDGGFYASLQVGHAGVYLERHGAPSEHPEPRLEIVGKALTIKVASVPTCAVRLPSP